MTIPISGKGVSPLVPGDKSPPSPVTNNVSFSQFSGTASEVAKAASEHSPLLESRSAAQPLSGFNLLDSRQLAVIKGANSEDEARESVHWIDRFIEFLLSIFKKSHRTRSDAAAALFNAAGNTSPWEAAKCLKKLVRKEECHHIKLEIIEDGSSNQNTFYLKLTVGGIEVRRDYQNSLGLNRQEAGLRLLEYLNPNAKVRGIVEKIEEEVTNITERPKTRANNIVSLSNDLPRAKYIVNEQTLIGFKDVGEREYNTALFRREINAQFRCTPQQQHSIEAFSHQGAFNIIYSQLKNFFYAGYLQSDTANMLYTLKMQDGDVVLYGRVESDWKSEAVLKKNRLGPKPEILVEPVVSFCLRIAQDGSTSLAHLNTYSSRS